MTIGPFSCAIECDGTLQNVTKTRFKGAEPMASGTPIICSVCSSDRFVQGRKLERKNFADGSFALQWTSTLEDGGIVGCLVCRTVYKWNAATGKMDAQAGQVLDAKKPKK